MNHLRPWLGILATALSCGGAGIGETEDGGPEKNTYQSCEQLNGTRIQLETFSTPDGEISYKSRAYTDIRYGSCYLSDYPDNNEGSATACVPLSNGGEIFFTDINCQIPVAHFSSANFVREYVEHRPATATLPSIYKVGDLLATPPASVYLPAEGGSCRPRPLPADGVFAESSGRIDISELVTFEESTLSAGQIAQPLYEGQDGSKICGTTDFKDSVLASECQFLPKEDGLDTLACFPTGAATITEGFSDDTCETPTLIGQQRSDGVHRFGAHYVRVDECFSRRDIYDVTPVTTTSFRQDSEGVCLANGTSGYSVGNKVDEDYFVVADFFVKPESEGRLRRGFYKTPEGLLIDKGNWWDSKLNTKCSVGSTSSSTSFRCTPSDTGRVTDVFTDSTCETTIQAVVADKCDTEPQGYGSLREDDQDSFWELIPRTAPSFYSGRHPETRIVGCYEQTLEVFDLGVEISVDSLGTVQQTKPSVQ